MNPLRMMDIIKNIVVDGTICLVKTAYSDGSEMYELEVPWIVRTFGKHHEGFSLVSHKLLFYGCNDPATHKKKNSTSIWDLYKKHPERLCTTVINKGEAVGNYIKGDWTPLKISISEKENGLHCIISYDKWNEDLGTIRLLFEEYTHPGGLRKISYRDCKNLKELSEATYDGIRKQFEALCHTKLD